MQWVQKHIITLHVNRTFFLDICLGNWGPDDRVVWGAGLSSCDLQVAGLIPVATRSCAPPRLGFGDCDTLHTHGCDWNEFQYTLIWAELGHDADPPENANYYGYCLRN